MSASLTREPGFAGCRVVGHGPNWLFLRPVSDPETSLYGKWPAGGPRRLSDLVMEAAGRQMVYRVVLELDGLEALRPDDIDDLVGLRARLMEHGGALRLCGLRPECAEALRRATRCADLQSHADPHAAVGDSWLGGPIGPPAPGPLVVRKARPR